MNFSTKRKIKKFIKEKWKFLLGSAIFLTVGLVVMLVGFSLSGWSIIQWLHSPWAVTSLIFIVGGIFLFVMAILIKKQVELLQ